jgi:hypothetical protein
VIPGGEDEDGDGCEEDGEEEEVFEADGEVFLVEILGDLVLDGEEVVGGGVGGLAGLEEGFEVFVLGGGGGGGDEEGDGEGGDDAEEEAAVIEDGGGSLAGVDVEEGEGVELVWHGAGLTLF